MGKKLVRKQYYLMPFPVPIYDDQAIVLSRRKYELKANCTLIDGFSNGCLAKIENTATLIIDGHCSAEQPDFLSITWVADGKTLHSGWDPITLAEKLVLFGLDQGHIKIRMLACFGGLQFAQRLARCLGLSGYLNIHVAGYMHSVATYAYNPKTGFGSHALKIDDQDVYKDEMEGRNRIRWFDANGDETQKPQIDANWGEVEDPWIL